MVLLLICIIQQWRNKIPRFCPILQLVAPWAGLSLSVFVLFCSPHLLLLKSHSPFSEGWGLGIFVCAWLAVLWGWCDGARGSEAIGGRTYSGGIFQPWYASRSAHADSQNHTLAGGACAPSHPARKVHSVAVPRCCGSVLPCAPGKRFPAPGPRWEHVLVPLLPQCFLGVCTALWGATGRAGLSVAWKWARAYRPLVTASEDEDVNCRVTRSRQGTEQALLCVVEGNLLSNTWAVSAQAMQSWVCLCTCVFSSPEWKFSFLFLFYSLNLSQKKKKNL